MFKALIGLLLLIGFIVAGIVIVIVMGRELAARSFHYTPYIVVGFLSLGAVSRVWTGIVRLRRGRVTGHQSVWHKNYDVLSGLASLVWVGAFAAVTLTISQGKYDVHVLAVVVWSAFPIGCLFLLRAFFYRWKERNKNTASTSSS